nr:SNF2-related protein [Candidatus Sigynarchaeota archaeon]
MASEFLIPALERSILYLRVAGYFSSSVLTIAAAGIAKLIHNGGEMRMIVGADLSSDDADAMNRGAMSINDYVQKSYQLEFEKLDDLQQFIAEERHKALYWLIAKGRLKIKIAVLVDDDGRVKRSTNEGIFHEKWGMFYDREGNSIGFIGSDNESGQAWIENQERFKLFRSWMPEAEYFSDEVEDFELYWTNTEPGIEIYEITDAVEQKLIRYRASEPPTEDPWENKEKIQSLREKQGLNTQSTGKMLGVHGGFQFLEPEQFKAYVTGQYIQHCYGLAHGWTSLLETVPFKPLEHQIYIAHEIYNHFPRGYMLCDEVGLGKTIEAGLAIKWLVMAGLVKRVLVIAPRNVITQWQEELREKFNLEFLVYDPPALISYWKEIYEPRSVNAYDAHNFILVSSGLLKLDARINEVLAASDWDMLVIDEAHHLRRKPSKTKSTVGATGKLLELAQKLKLKAKCFLMLTATPIQLRIEELFDLLQLLGLGGKWGLRDRFKNYYDILAIAPKARTKDQWTFLIDMALDFLKHGRTNPAMYESELQTFDERPKFFRELLEIFVKGYDFLPYLEEYHSDPAFLESISKELELLTPLRWFMFRNTRQQLSRYGINVAKRDPVDVSITMTTQEKALYHQVEQYIVEIYNNAEEEQKQAQGFTLAVYRRRLTSSFMAIKKTLERRKEKILEQQQQEKNGEEVELLSEDDEEDSADDE